MNEIITEESMHNGIPDNSIPLISKMNQTQYENKSLNALPTSLLKKLVNMLSE